MKRYLIAAGVGSMVFAAALGSASALSIDPGVAQAGTAALRGDTNGVVVESYGYESDDTTSRFIRVADVDPNLAGEKLWAMVLDGNKTVIGKGSAAIDSTGKVTVRWANPVPVQDIEHVRLVIE